MGGLRRMMLEPKFEVLGAGWLQLSGWAYLVCGVAGHHLVDRGRMIEQSIGRVAHGADHGHLVVDLGQRAVVL